MSDVNYAKTLVNITPLFIEYLKTLDDSSDNESYETQMEHASSVLDDFSHWLLRKTPKYEALIERQATLNNELHELNMEIQLYMDHGPVSEDTFGDDYPGDDF